MVQSEPKLEAGIVPVPQRRRMPMSTILAFVVGLVGVAAIGANAWTYSETQRDLARLSTDIAQIKLSLALFGQQQAVQPAEAASPPADDTALTEITNRLDILEQNWRSGTPAAAATPGPATLPPLPASGEPAAVAATGGDCLPTGTRFMVAAGDSYPICGTTGKVEIGAIDNGFITLADGTVIAQGGTIGLPGTRCMVGVVPSDGGSISGFAEIRVTC